MKLTLAVLALTLAAFVSGCSPALSIRPLYTDADLKKPILEPRIEGEWVSPDVDKLGTDEELSLKWKIDPPKQPGQSYSTYSVELRPVHPDRERGEPVIRYDARLVPIGEKLFFDATLGEHVEGQVKVTPSDEPLGLVPAHLVGRIWVQQDFLRIALPDSRWVKDSSQETFHKFISLDKSDDVAIITAPTPELRNFLLLNSDNDKAMAYIYYLCRSGSECAARGLEEELRRRPDDKDILKTAADYFLLRGNFGRAAEIQRHRADLEPKDASRHADVAEALLLKRDFAGTRRELAEVQRLAQADSPAGGPLSDVSDSAYAHAAEDIVWSYFLEGEYAEALIAANKYKPSEEHFSVNPILLSYFSLVRLGRRAAAESLLKEETAKFTGSAEEHILLLEAQGRVSQGFPYSDPKSEALRRFSFFGGLQDIATGRLDAARVHLGSAASEPSDSVIALAARIELERLGPKPKK